MGTEQSHETGTPEATKLGEFSVATVSRDTLLYLPGRVVPAIASVVAIPLFTHFFLPEEFGRYQLALNFVLFMNMLTTLWLEMTILRFYPAYVKHGKEDVYLSVIGLVRAGSVVFGLVVLGFIAWLGPERLVGSYRSMLGVAALVFVSQGYYQSGQSILRARQLPLVFSIAAGINVVSKIALGLVIAVIFKLGVVGLLWAGAIMPALMYFVFMRKHFMTPPLRLDHDQKKFLNESLSYGIPVAATLVLNFLLMRMDLFLLKYMLGEAGDAQVGIYGVNHELVGQPLNMTMSTLMLAVMPAVASKYEAAGRKAAEDLIGGLTRVFTLLLLPAAAFLWILAQPLFVSLTRGDFQQGYNAAPWVALGWLLLGYRQYGTMGLHLAKRTGLLAAVTLLAVVVSFAGNWILIPTYGYMGCAVMRGVSQGVLLIVGAMVSARFLGWPIPVASFCRTCVATAGASLALYWATPHVPHNIVTVALLFGAGFGVYGVLLLALREAKWDEVMGFTKQVLGRR